MAEAMTSDGRKLAYLEVGDPHGPLVLHLRLVCVDRPGMGQSSTQKDRLVPDPINKAVAGAMPGAVWHPVAEAAHFVAVGVGDEILAIAAEELGAP